MKSDWEGLYGQSLVKKTLQHFIDSSKVPHALLFQGDNGIGKDFTAIKFAQLLNRNSPDYLRVSKLITSFSEPYIKFIFPLPRGKNETEDSGPFEKLTTDEMQIIKEQLETKAENPYYRISIPKSSGIKISSIRDIKKFLSFDYSDITYRIILISDAHLMNEEAQNALLKSLEEPPDGVIFILTTQSPELLRETIRSRCWNIKFQQLSEEDISSILVSYYDTEKDYADKIAPFAGGSVNFALQLIESDFNELQNNTILLLRYSFGGKIHSALSILEQYLKAGNVQSLKLMINMILLWFNDLQRNRAGLEEVFYKDHKETLQKFNTKFPAANIINTIRKLEKSSTLFQRNVNPAVIILSIVYELSSVVRLLKT